jgi:hypothetical protein
VTISWPSLLIDAAVIAFGVFVIRRLWRSWRDTDDRWAERAAGTSPDDDRLEPPEPTRHGSGRDPQT